MKLFNEHNEPVYQPGLNLQLKYQEPTSRDSATGWFTGEPFGEYDQEITREDAAKILEVSVDELVKWENETDHLAESDLRDNDCY